MSVNSQLVADVKRRAEEGVPILAFSRMTIAALKTATVEFALAPDEFIDIGRLPSTVFDLQTLLGYLKVVKNKLLARDTKVKTGDWEVAKSGELKLYKLYVCAIHAMSSYASSGANYDQTPSEFCKSIAAHARSHPPDGLGKNGSTLWEKTFGNVEPRVLAVLKSLVYFCEGKKSKVSGARKPPTEDDEESTKSKESKSDPDKTDEDPPDDDSKGNPKDTGGKDTEDLEEAELDYNQKIADFFGSPEGQTLE